MCLRRLRGKTVMVVTVMMLLWQVVVVVLPVEVRQFVAACSRRWRRRTAIPMTVLVLWREPQLLQRQLQWQARVRNTGCGCYR